MLVEVLRRLIAARKLTREAIRNRKQEKTKDQSNQNKDKNTQKPAGTRDNPIKREITEKEIKASGKEEAAIDSIKRQDKDGGGHVYEKQIKPDRKELQRRANEGDKKPNRKEPVKYDASHFLIQGMQKMLFKKQKNRGLPVIQIEPSQ